MSEMKMTTSDKLEILTKTVRKRPKLISGHEKTYSRLAGGVVYVPKKLVGHQVLIIPTSRSLRVYRILQAVFGSKIVKIS